MDETETIVRNRLKVLGWEHLMPNREDDVIQRRKKYELAYRSVQVSCMMEKFEFLFDVVVS